MTTIKEISFKDASSWQNLLDLIYPINSTYISVGSTSPATLFGGTWTALTTGVIRAANANNAVANGDSFTLAWNNLPQHVHWTSITTGNNSTGHSHSISHTHTLPLNWAYNETKQNGWYIYHKNQIPGNPNGGFDGRAALYQGTAAYQSLSTTTISTSNSGSNSTTHTHSGSAWSNGGADASITYGLKSTPDSISRLPNYQNVYMWKRTA